MWDLPGPGLKPVSPALAGEFLTTALPGKPLLFCFLIYLFIYLFLVVFGLHCCARAFSSCAAQASHCSGFSCCKARALGAQASVVVDRGL